MPGSIKPELFESQNKTSMGLQIIKALSQQINATITLDVDNGTRFTIHMPSVM